MARYTRRAKGNKRFIRTKRTELKRLFQRGCYDRRIIYRILDEGFICHVGFINAGHPVVIPTAYGRLEDVLYIHGSAASRMLRKLADGIQVCVTVTLVDGPCACALRLSSLNELPVCRIVRHRLQDSRCSRKNESSSRVLGPHYTRPLGRRPQAELRRTETNVSAPTSPHRSIGKNSNWSAD